MSDFSSKIKEIEKQLKRIDALSQRNDIFTFINNDGKRERIKRDMESELKIITDQIRFTLNELSPPASGDTRVANTSKTKAGNSHEFANFLSSIGESVVASQENLDRESINYLKRLKETDMHGSIIPPTVFRIPKLKASLNLGIEKSSSEKLNVLIYGKEEESKLINQQSIELEIMAVPASAELLQNLEGKIPQIQFVLSPRERENIFQKIVRAITFQEIKKEHYGDMLETKNRNKVIFWRTTKNKTSDPDIFLVLYAGKSDSVENKPRHVCMWQLDFTNSKMTPIIRYDLAPRANTQQDQGLLHDFVAKIATSQMKLLNG